MAEKDQTNRWRCTVVGCNPVLIGNSAADSHSEASGHRIAKWPIRSKAGKKQAEVRSKTGYYDQYNVGSKSYENRGHHFDPDYDERMQNRNENSQNTHGYEDDHIFSEDALGQS
jgi:hypothetical protein